MTLQNRIERTAAFVKNHQEKMAATHTDANFNPSYRWQHTLRVANIGMQIAKAENANLEQVVLGCLLHDVASFDDPVNRIDHGRLGARVSRPFLAELGLPSADVEAICYAVALHVDGKADFEHPETIECKIVSDADNVDRFDAYRMLLHFHTELEDLDTLAEKMTARIATLEGYRERQIMGTATGNKLFTAMLDRQIEVFKAVVAQKELSVLPVVG